jgi:hypothetical protein
LAAPTTQLNLSKYNLFVAIKGYIIIGGQRYGFNLFHGIKAVPTSRAYSHFFNNLFKHEDMIEKMFHKLVDEVSKELPEFGKIQACDGKAITTHANGRKTEQPMEVKDGSAWEKVKSYSANASYLYLLFSFYMIHYSLELKGRLLCMLY